MGAKVTIVISPRDRYSGLKECIENVYENTDTSQFELIALDLGYPRGEIRKAQDFIANKDNAKIIDMGHIIPMAAIDQIRTSIHTSYTVLLDNDSRLTPNWLLPLLETATVTDAAVISPLILEREGVDEGAELRNHLYTTQLRVVEVDSKPYLIEDKTYRRVLPEDIPKEIADSEAFELHCVMFNTKDLQTLEIPYMTIREHLDIGLQLKNKGRRLVVEPRSVCLFDNLGTRAALSDLRYFNLRWNSKITQRSSRLFEQRWGYNFYSEESIYNWAIRRRSFLVMKWLYLPTWLVNKIDRVLFAIRRQLFPIWDPLSDPIGNSIPLVEYLGNQYPNQLDHSTR